jgi:hypothetical protein
VGENPDGRCDITGKLGDEKTVICLSVSVVLRILILCRYYDKISAISTHLRLVKDIADLRIAKEGCGYK